MTFRPLNFIRANGYAANEQSRTFNITVIVVTIVLLRRYVQNGKAEKTLTKFMNVKCSGINLGGYAKIFSPPDLRAVDKSHKKGPIMMIATNTNNA